MRRRLTLLLFGLAATLAVYLPAASQADAKTFYWISHGSPADPVWTYFLAGAKQWAKDTGNTVNTSFHNGDVPSQQEAVRAAIAAKADGIVTTQPRSGQPGRGRQGGERPPASRSSTSTRPTRPPSFDAYVGGDNVAFGKHWAQYLVDKGLVKSGDFVWMPVEVPGATYGVQEEEGIKSVFEPLGITWEVTDATLDQAEVITRMADYLTANRDKIKAIIGLGDLVTGSIKRVFDQVGVEAGRNPGRRLGQLARHHPGGADRLRQCRAVAGPAGDQLRRACRWPRWRRAASRRASTSSPARSTRRTRRRSTTTSCPASRLRSRGGHGRDAVGRAPGRLRHLQQQIRRGTTLARPTPDRAGPSSGRSSCSSSSSWSSGRSTPTSCRRTTSATRWPSPSSSA